MEDVFALVVLTLLQLCRGEISQPEWFAANQVNEADGYTPKPITEIFTSDSPFTSKNPALFTQPTTSTTSTLPPSPKPLPSARSTQNGSAPPSQNGGQMPEIMSQVVENPTRNELPNFLIVFDPRAQTNQNSPPPGPPPSLPTLPQTTGTQTQPTISASTSSTTPTPQTLQTDSTPPFPLNVPQQNQNTLLPFPFQQRVSPQMLSTISPPNWALGSILAYPVQVPGANPWISSTNSTLPTATAGPVLPPVKQPARPVVPKNPPRILSIHVKAPTGSITNIRINPTTTVRPSTTRRRKTTRRTNTYESCVSKCNGKKEPICSTPTGVTPIDPDRLKGFPSLCHMACHNSFKKELYEKVTDGRCGRLRTRIRPVDKNKLNREELTKAQYTIVHNVPETIVEFSPARQ